MGSKPLWLLPLRETLSSLHGTINKPLLCSWGACYVSMSRLWLYKYFWKHSPEQMQPVLIKCTEMWDPWRIFFQTYVVVIKRDRYEQQPKAIYAKVLMQRFKPPLVSSGILIFLTLATGPYQIYQSIKSLIGFAFKIPLEPTLFSPLLSDSRYLYFSSACLWCVIASFKKKYIFLLCSFPVPL